MAKYPLRMSAPELQAAFGGESNAGALRGLIMAEVCDIRNGSGRDERTLRGFWYDYVKPLLSRLGLLHKLTSNNKPVDWDAKLSKYVAEQVRHGSTSYKELALVDGSRQRRVAQAVNVGIADVTLAGDHFPWVILFTEKDAAWGAVESVARLYGVSAISGGGVPSAVCTANTIEAILDHKNSGDGPLVLLSLTDYDPAGYAIARAQCDQIKEVSGGRAVDHVRLGLVPEQLTAAERAAKAYTPKEDGLAAWYAETGGVDGDMLGLELDALGLARIRAMFAAGIEQQVNTAPLWDDLRRAYVDLIAWGLLLPQVAKQLDALRAVVWDGSLGQAIRNEVMPGDLFRAAAAAGWDSINPTNATFGGRPLFDHTNDIAAAMVETGVGWWRGPDRV